MKKVFGVVFLVLGGLAAFSTIKNIGSILESIQGVFNCVGRNCEAAHLGTLTGRLLFVALAVGLILTGLRWANASPAKKTTDSQAGADSPEEKF